MRLIKFRAWNNFENKMIYPEKHIKDDVMVIRCLSGKAGYEWTSEGGGGVEDDDNLIPMQFTGLKDKSGKEIYEGDIIKGRDSRDCDVLVKVEWEDICCGFSPFAIYDTELERWVEGNMVEVIGNIYENPELLGGV